MARSRRTAGLCTLMGFLVGCGATNGGQQPATSARCEGAGCEQQSGNGAEGRAEGGPTAGGAQPADASAGEEPASDDRARADRLTRGLFLSGDSARREEVRSNAALEVWFVKKTADGGEETIDPGATMHTGERFFMRAEARKPLYVYIAYIDPGGNSHLLFPSGDQKHLQLEPGERARVPPDQLIELDEQVGAEQIYVIASGRPMSELDDETARTLEAIRDEARLPAEDAPEEDEDDEGAYAATAQMRTRGLQLVDEQDDTVVSTTDDEGVAVVYFPIDHVE